MKIYNRFGGPFDIHWSEDGQVHATEKKTEEGKIIQRAGSPSGKLVIFHIDGGKVSPDLPTTLCQYLLKEYPKRFTADEGAIESELATAKKIAEQNQKIADHENRLRRIRDLVTRSSDTSNKAAAKAAAKELDELLKEVNPPASAEADPALAPLPPPVDPAPAKPPGVESEQGDFEKAP